MNTRQLLNIINMSGVIIRYDKCLAGWYLEYRGSIMFVEDPDRAMSRESLEIMALQQLG